MISHEVYRGCVIFALATLLKWLVQSITGRRGATATMEPIQPPIADEVEGWLWLRDELGHGGSSRSDARRNEPRDKR